MSAPNESVEVGLLRLLTDDDIADGAHITCFQLGMGIVANPQAHIDALVEAGVLALAPTKWGGHATYGVIAPHVHEWRVTNAMPGDALGRCEIACATCPPNVLTNCVVPNRLPIEVPS